MQKWLFYDGDQNFNFDVKDWSGSVSFWIKVDPINKLDPGYVDPIQITPNTWNDASFFVDFDKEGSPRLSDLGPLPIRLFGIQRIKIFQNQNALWLPPNQTHLAIKNGHT